MTTLAARVARWAPRMGASVADQGTGAVTHLVLHVALARLVTPSEYGAFALAFALLLFLMGAHLALIAEPMTVLGPVRYGSSLRVYVRATMRVHARLAMMGAVGGAMIALMAAPWSADLGRTLMGLVVLVPTFLTFMLLRRVCYVLTRPADALWGSLLYALAVLPGLLVLHRMDRLSSLMALVLMAVGAGIAAGAMLTRLSLPRIVDAPGMDRLWRENWRYGRWILAANLAHWGGTGVYLFFVGALAGLAEAGVFRALQTLVSPAQQFLAGLALLALPWLAKQRAERGGTEAGVGQILRMWAPAIILVAAYGLVLWEWGEIITRIVYGREEYTQAAGLLPAFSLFILLMAVAQGLALGLRSSERSEPVFWSKLAGSLVALVPGLAMTWQWGLAGAAWGMALSVGTEGAVLAAALSTWREG